QGDDPLEGPRGGGDVGLGGARRQRGPGGLRVAEGDGVEVLPAGDHVHGEGVLLGVDEVARGVDQLAHRGDAERADDAAGGDQRPHPVGDVDDVVHRAAGEEVLVAAGEPDHLVREHGADDQVDVAVDDEPVDLHAHRDV